MIVCSAIKHKDTDAIWTGKRHDECFKKLYASAPSHLEHDEKQDWTERTMARIIYGFLTDKGEFLDRTEAYYYAIKSGQIKDDGKKPYLISEMLWED